MGRSLAQKRSFLPSVEGLEQRSLMACSILAAGGVLTIVGDGANDHVTLYDDGHGSVVGSADGAGDFSYTGIKDIVVDAGAGNDIVDYHITGKIEAGPVAHTIQVNLRDGDDAF